MTNKMGQWDVLDFLKDRPNKKFFSKELKPHFGTTTSILLSKLVRGRFIKSVITPKERGGPALAYWFEQEEKCS